MSYVKILPSLLNGNIKVPPSKSELHRVIICAFLSRGISKIFPVCSSQDIMSTINAIKLLGAKAKIDNSSLIIDSTNLETPQNLIIDCNESGSTLRFLIPVVAALGIDATFVGKKSLASRPIDVYICCLPKFNVNCISSGNGLPFKISGKLTNGTFLIPGDISSQFVSGLLMALALVNGDSVIKLTSKLESSSYVDMTINTMKKFGVNIIKIDDGFYIKGNQKYKSIDYEVESDWSQAAFFVGAGALGTNITINGLNKDSIQGDIECINLFKKFGANIYWKNNILNVSAKKLNAVEVIDVRQIPDLVPIIAVVAALSKGTSKIIGAKRLKLKESDRLKSISSALKILGADIIKTEDGLIINGKESLNSGVVTGNNDHRIVMALAIGALKARGEVTIKDASSVNKSYPSFFKDYNSIGGKANVIDVGR